MKRHKMSRHGSKAHFSHHAARTHHKNMLAGASTVMRGGIRL